ncbi:MAG TPA: permease-like cell division protein FtsX [Candidatus Saccharimonadia bacterium]|nr:permease-like cell division protein FtsX [Candidatus Saccharimonadia bacterium]
MAKPEAPPANRRVVREEAAVVHDGTVSWRERLRSYGGQHAYGALSSLGRLWQRRAATLLTIAVMGLALALPMMLYLSLRNLEQYAGAMRDARELTVFVTPGAEPETVATLEAQLAADPDVAVVSMRPPDEGLAELSALPGFADAIALLEDNPLPALLLVAPAASLDAPAIGRLARRIEALPGVDLVQYDLEWRDRLTRALALAERLVAIVALVLGIGALLVVGNTIRLDVQGRADEIAIVQQLGGSNGFVRRPFLYAGCWYGLFAALLAFAGCAVVMAALRAPVAALAASYGGAIGLVGLDLELAAATVAAGVLLGWIGAWVACGRHLARGKPA